VITIGLVGLVFGIIFYKATYDAENVTIGTIFGLIVGLIIAIIIGACLPERTNVVQSQQLEVLNVGKGDRNYYLEAIDVEDSDYDYYIYQTNGKIITVAGGYDEKLVVFTNYSKPYVEYNKTDVDFSRVPRWSLLFGFGRWFHNSESVTFYLPEGWLYEVP